jgi:streptomycin 6-kinase
VDISSPVLEATRVRLVARFGEEVAAWWARLPGAIELLAARWDLVVGEPVGRGNTSVVIRCRRGDGARAVLKLCPDPSLSRGEAQALRAWRSSGRVPALWEADVTVGALLLEALPDERPLSERAEPVAIGDVAGLLRALHVPPPASPREFPALSARIGFIFDHWIERYRPDPAVSRVVPSERLERGRQVARELATGDGAPVLLHGDLHAGNVLDGGSARGLVAIDPARASATPRSTPWTGSSGARTTPAPGRRDAWSSPARSDAAAIASGCGAPPLPRCSRPAELRAARKRNALPRCLRWRPDEWCQILNANASGRSWTRTRDLFLIREAL